VGGVDFTTRNRGVAVGAYGMALWTTDGGATWNLASAPGASGVAFHGVKMVTRSLGYAVCSNQTVLKTTDGGKSWVTILAPWQ